LNGHATVCETLRKTHFHPGGFSEYVRVPAINVDRGVYKLPDEVSFEEATFIEPLACVLRGQQLAGIQPGHRVLVIGSGIAGLLHVQAARTLGAGRIIATDISDFRLKAARELGADETIHASEDVPARLREVNDGRLAEVVILCTGAETAILQGLKSVDRGGTVLFFAPAREGETLPLTINDLFWRSEITLTSSYAGAPGDHITAMEWIRGRRVRVREMITHRLGLAEAVDGFRMVTEAGNSIKIIIEPQR
jgi:L-iditol 2-dehydrogenase